MQTLYIDVYFLINFTVDFIALYFSCLFINIKTTLPRLITSSVLGAVFAALTIILNIHNLFYAILLVLSACFIVLICAKGLDFFRGLKLLCCFLIMETLLGGIISFLFSVLDENLYVLFENISFGAENKKILLLSTVILITYAILKLAFFMLGRGEAQGSYEINIVVNGENARVNALLDTGSFLKDPMNMKPVILVKKKAVLNYFSSFGEDFLINSSGPLAGRLRVIPVKSVGGDKILMGVRTDYIEVIKGKRKHIINAVVAIDEDSDGYGGYDALMPADFGVL